MNRTLAFFDVDTQEPGPGGRGLRCQQHAGPIAPVLRDLFEYARAQDIVIVSTTCVHAKGVQRALAPDVLFVPLDGVFDPGTLNGCPRVRQPGQGAHCGNDSCRLQRSSRRQPR